MTRIRCVHSALAAAMFLECGLLTSDAQAKPPQVAAKKSVSYTGRVLDRISGTPLSGAIVTIERILSPAPEDRKKAFKRVSKATTNAKGEYSLTLKPDEVARPNLYIIVEARHAKCASKGRSGYSYKTIQKNQRQGDSPFFSEIKLWPGEDVTAVVETPDGKPVAGAKITTFARHEKAARFEFMGFHETKTDTNGRFRFSVPTPGMGAFWIYPKGYAVQGQLIKKQRGDIGKIVVQKGARLKGRVLDAKGKPVANVYVGARKTRGDSELEEFLNQNAVANLTVRHTNTNKKGEFELEDLPGGDYSVRVEPGRNELTQPAKHVFLRSTIKLSMTEKPAEFVARAIPHVKLHAAWVDGEGKPTRGYQFYVQGRLDGRFWFARTTRPDKKTGKVSAAVPHGLQDAFLQLIANEHSGLRWRVKPGGQLRRGQRVPLGNIDDDRFGIQIVRYTAPILVVKTVDEQGAIVRDATIQSEYEPEKPPAKFGTRSRTGDVRFRRQKDGRWRSSQMLPDENVTITVKKTGYEAKPKKILLKEGKEGELVFVLKKKS